jgi:lipoprotein-releasing system permease protein
MGYPVTVALRYLVSKKRSFISVGTAFAMLGVMIGVAALATVMSVTGGFQKQFRDKVLGVNAHVLVLKYSVDFREYPEVMKKVAQVPGVKGVAPFIINPMMVTHGGRTATGVLLKGVDPEFMPKVLDLPRHIVDGNLDGLRQPGAKAPERRVEPFDSFPTFPSGDAGAKEKHSGLRDLAPTPIPATPTGTSVAGTVAHDPLDAGAAIADGKPAIMGDVTPDGGYASKLPTDDDFLPESIDPDPCKSPEQIKKLPGVIVGRTLSKQLAVGLGDCLQITSPTIGISLGASGARPPIAKQFRVIAIFEAGFDQYDSKLVYTDLYEAQAFYDQGDSVTGVEMTIDDIDDSGAIAKEIDRRLANGVYHTMDWRELNHGLFTALLIQQIGMSFMLALIVLVAAFTVVAVLIMVVLDKKREIALLKALGATDNAILRIFLYQGTLIGMVGTGLGLILGYICCRAIAAYPFPLDPKVYFISHLPVLIRPNEFLVTGAISVFICSLATIVPALYASRVRPADGLRAE